jgi:hypothetical protein
MQERANFIIVFQDIKNSTCTPKQTSLQIRSFSTGENVGPGLLVCDAL